MYVHLQTVIQSKFNCTVAYNAAILQQIYNIRLYQVTKLNKLDQDRMPLS